MAYFTKAIEMERGKKNGYKNRAESYCRLGMYREGLEDWEKVGELEPENAEWKEKRVAVMRMVAEQEGKGNKGKDKDKGAIIVCMIGDKEKSLLSKQITNTKTNQSFINCRQ